MKECCKNCNHYKKLETWTYTDTAEGQSVEHVTASGFACTGFINEDVIVNLVGLNEAEDLCEMFSPKKDYEKQGNRA